MHYFKVLREKESERKKSGSLKCRSDREIHLCADWLCVDIFNTFAQRISDPLKYICAVGW